MHWGPHWTPAEDEAFRAAVDAYIAAETWVADGNYGAVRDRIWQRATTIIWLDYPLPLVLWRLFRRTLWRTLTRQRLFNDNREPFFRAFFSRDSLFVWALRTHYSRRQRYNQHFADGDFANAAPIVFHKPAHAEAFLELVCQVSNDKNAP